MRIPRQKYINDLKIRMGNGLVKVITGLRRCGKSYLLFNLFYEYLLQNGVKENLIIKVALDDDRYKELRNPEKLSEYVRSRIKGKKKVHYVFLDEVQYAISNKELHSTNDNRPIKLYDVLNGLMKIPNADIYITGSNSKFLSTDILTEFRGRGDEVHIMPLSFGEFMQGFSGDIYNAWAEYVLYGGLPFLLTMQTDEQKSKYLANIFKETYIKDISERNKIEKSQELETLAKILASSAGSLTSPNKIWNTFKTELHSQISLNTIIRYFGFLKDSFLISEASRYDVKGRKYIGSPLKYYFEDIGIRNAVLNFRQFEENHLMENVIYNELLFRGYNVDVGIVEKRKKTEQGKQERQQYEIDFVANLGSKRYYIQSAFEMSSPEKEAQEKKSLLNVNDSFKKIIIVKDIIKPRRDDSGILAMSLFEFLQNPDSLEL